MRLVLALCVVVSLVGMACSSDRRDYQGVLFRCDTNEQCPVEDKCVDHRCEPLSVGQPGVICGDRVCIADSACCTPVGLSFCSTSCGAAVSRECDGTEDCTAGALCCIDSAGGSECVEGSACPSDTLIACSDHTQCPAAQPSCCHGIGANALKRCGREACI